MVLQRSITIYRNYKPVYFMNTLKYVAYMDINSCLILTKL